MAEARDSDGRAAGPSPERRARLALTQKGRLLAAAALAFAVLGALALAPGVAALGACVLSLLAAAHLGAVVARQRVARLTIDVAAAGDALKLWEGHVSEVALTLRLPERAAVYGVALAPVTSDTLEARLDASHGAERGLLPYALSLKGKRLGDAWLHGFELTAHVALGLYEVEAFLPRLLRATVLPRHMAQGHPPLRATRAAANEQADLVHRERRGFGMEIRELRDFQAGDPFKHIAWSASARRGKLIAREFESDLQLSIWLLVDCSPSMFWGPPGQAKIDLALALAADLTRSLSGGRDRVGLILHDHDRRLLVEPGHGAAHLARLTQALLEAPHLLHEDRTELTDLELVSHVARWFEVYEGRAFLLPPSALPPPAPPPEGPTLGRSTAEPAEPGGRRTPAPRQHPRAAHIDETALVRACREHLERRFGRGRPLVPADAYAIEPERSILRAFARHFGVALPRDPTPRPGGQSHGLEAALQAMLTTHHQSGAHTLLAISDFHTCDDQDALRRVALIGRRHRHSLVFVVPTGDRGLMPPGKRSRDARLMNALVEVAELQADENLRAAQAILRPAGATFVTAHAGDSVARILARLRAVA